MATSLQKIKQAMQESKVAEPTTKKPAVKETKVDGRTNNPGRPKGTTRKVVMMRIEVDVLAQLDAIAKAENATRTVVIDAALRKAIESYGVIKQKEIF